MVAGIVVGGLGLVSGGIGAALLFDGSGLYSTNPATYGVVKSSGEQTAGAGMVIGGVLGIGIAVPLIVWGAKKVPVQGPLAPAAASAVPVVRVGARSLLLTWQL